MLKSSHLIIPALILALGCVSGTDRAADEAAQAESQTDTEAPMTEAGGPTPVSGDTVTTESGLQYIVISSGDGPAPEPGQTVYVHYTGWFTDGGKFDSSLDRGVPFAFPLGQRRVIAGWDEGVALMRVGDKRRFIIPPDLAYGEGGHPAGIPPNSTLIFDVELVSVE
jgi:FKBP-type peptidyl-prolyl cis-trans isomerase FkpA